MPLAVGVRLYEANWLTARAVTFARLIAGLCRQDFVRVLWPIAKTLTVIIAA